MRKKLPVLLDRPETQVVGVTAIYSVICFFSLPFILLLMLGGFEDNIVVISWFEIIFHVLNFVVMVGLFKDYLYEAMDNLRIHKKEVIRTILIAMGLMLVVMEVWFALLQSTLWELLWEGKPSVVATDAPNASADLMMPPT